MTPSKTTAPDKSLKERLEAIAKGLVGPQKPRDNDRFWIADELRAIAQALQEQADEMHRQCDARYAEGRYEEGAGTNDVCAWADALAPAAPGREKE